MFRHCVLLRWSPEASDLRKRALREGLAELRGTIEEIQSYHYGEDAGLAEGNFDFAIVADFDDEAAYRQYAQHSAHLQLIEQHVKPIVAERVAVQFWQTPERPSAG